MRLVFAALVIAIIVALVGTTGASADPGVTLDQVSGSADEEFVFSGAGFEPGTVLRGKYTTPAGKEYGFTAGYGEATFVAGPDGAWQLSFSPSKSPYGEGAPGEWKFSFCLSSDAAVCYEASFTVTGPASTSGGSGY
jgi:hypothetical protein